MQSSLLAALNLATMLLVGSFLAQAIAQKQWRRRGTASVIFLIIVAGQLWLIPQAISFFGFHSTRLLYPLWFGNWIASAVAVILFRLTARPGSRDLLDAAQLDGAGFFGIHRHVIWPIMKPALGALALILIMATWMEFARPLFPAGDNTSAPMALPPWLLPSTNQDIAILLAVSLLATLPVIAIHFAGRCFFSETKAAR